MWIDSWNIYLKSPKVNRGSSKSIHYEKRANDKRRKSVVLLRENYFSGEIFIFTGKRHTFCESLACNKRVSKRSDNFSRRVSSSRTEERVQARWEVDDAIYETGLYITSSSNITTTRHQRKKQLTVKDNKKYHTYICRRQ